MINKVEGKMKEMLKVYISEKKIWGYIALFFTILALGLRFELYPQYIWTLIIPVLLAPFYEWIAHKYLLHLKVNPDGGAKHKYMKKLH